MEKNEPNKIIKRFFKRYQELKAVQDVDKHDFKGDEKLKNELRDFMHIVGAVSCLNRDNILRLIRMQGSYRFMPEHSFYIAFYDGLYPVQELDPDQRQQIKNDINKRVKIMTPDQINSYFNKK